MDELVVGHEDVRRAGWRDDGRVAVAAAGAAVVVWCLATQVASVDLAVRSGSGTRDVGVVSVVVTAIVVAMAGAGLLQVLERRTSRGFVVWRWIALGVLVVSLAGPLGAASAAAGACLALLHLTVAAVVIGLLGAGRSGRVA